MSTTTTLIKNPAIRCNNQQKPRQCEGFDLEHSHPLFIDSAERQKKLPNATAKLPQNNPKVASARTAATATETETFRNRIASVHTTNNSTASTNTSSYALALPIATTQANVIESVASNQLSNFEPLQLKLLDKTSYTDVSTVDATMNTYPAAKSSVAFISTHNQRSDISSASWQTITSKIHDSFPDGCIIRHGDRSAGHIVYYHPAIGVISGGIAASHAGNNFKPLVQYCIDSKWVDPTLIVMSFTDMQTMIDMLMG